MKRAADIDISTIDTQSREFQTALTLVSFTRQSVFLTGKAGTGKSTFLKYLTQTTKKSHVVLAPTGIAAVNAGGQTLHSFFKLPFKPMLPDDPEVADDKRLRDRMKYKKDFVKMLRSLELIIIDEVSMVRADTIDFIDKLLRLYCGNRREPFAGKQLLLVGDVFQLEPVITGDMRDVLGYVYPNGSFFFNARAFQELPIVPIELTKVYRQNDDTFIRLLDRVRVGQPTKTDIDLLNARVMPDPTLFTDDFVMTIATRRDIVDSINQSCLDAIPGAARTFVGETEGDFPDNSLPTDKELELKIDAQVVFVKNDPDRRWVNGTIGKVREFNDDEIIVEVEDGTKHAVTIDLWENVKYEYDEEKGQVNEKVIGAYSQYPLKLAWALTIHKSQGLTFDRVVVDVGQGAFSGGQTYVALSRCRSLEGLKLRSTINQRDVFVNQRVVAFSRQFNNPALIQGAMEYAKADQLYSNAAKAFDAGEYMRAVDSFAEAVNARNVLDRPNAVRLIKHKVASLASLKDKVADLQERLAEKEAILQRLATEYVEMGEQVRQEGWEIESAIANFDKAISISPAYAPAHLCKGMAMAQAGNLDVAVDCFNEAAALDKADFRPLYEAGCLYINSGDVALGMDYLLRALDCNEKIGRIHLALAEGYDLVGDVDSAERHRRLAKKLKK